MLLLFGLLGTTYGRISGLFFSFSHIYIKSAVISRGGMQTENCKLCFFYFHLCFYHCYCFFISTRGWFSKHFSWDFSFLSVILWYFIAFKAFYFCHRFPIVNSAIVELAKLAIFCIHILYIITQNQILFRIAIVYLYKIWLVWPLLWCCYAGC